MKAESVVRRVRTHQTRSGTVPKGSILHARPPDHPISRRRSAAPSAPGISTGALHALLPGPGARYGGIRAGAEAHLVPPCRPPPSDGTLPGANASGSAPAAISRTNAASRPGGGFRGQDDLRPDCRRVKRLPRRNQGRAGRIFGTVVPRAGGGGLGGAGIRRQGVSLHRPGGRCRLRPEGGGAFRRSGYDRRGPFERVREAGRQAVPARQPRARRTAAAARGGARCRNYRAVRASFPSRCRPTGHAAHRLRAQYSVTSCSSACDSKALRGDTPPSRQPRM